MKPASIHGLGEGDRIIVKGAKGCGSCVHCRRGAARFCKKRTSYGGKTSCANPPHLFGGFADYIYLAPDVLVTKVRDSITFRGSGFNWCRDGEWFPVGDTARWVEDG